MLGATAISGLALPQAQAADTVEFSGQTIEFVIPFAEAGARVPGRVLQEYFDLP